MEDDEDAKFGIDLGAFDEDDSYQSDSRSNTNKHNTGRGSKWSDEEDELLRKTVETLGAKNWKKISSQIPGRTSTQ